MNKHFVGAILILALVAALAGQAWTSPPIAPPCVEYKLELDSVPSNGGATDLLFSFKLLSGNECDSVTLSFKAVKGMSYAGPTLVGVRVPPNGEYTTRIPVVVAPDDTSAFLIDLWCQDCDQPIVKTVITTDGGVRVLDYLPTPRGPEPPREQRVIDYTNAVQYPSSPVVAYPNSSDTAEFGRQPTAEERRLQMRESRLKQMHEMETEPLTELEAQVFTVDSVDYIRYRGETKFHVVVPIKDPWEHSRHVADSIAALPPEQECDIVLHLPETSQLQLARDLTDSLIPATRTGFYITRTTRAVIKQLSDAGIRIGFLDQMPEGTFSPAKGKENLDETEEDADSATPAHKSEPSSDAVLLFEEDFEGFWPGNWEANDLLGSTLTGYGPDYWGLVNCTSHSVFYSCWCSGEGDMSDCSRYDRMMASGLRTVDLIDLSAYDSVEVSNYIYFDLPSSASNASYYAYWSFDGVNWSYWHTVTAGSNFGWTYARGGFHAAGRDSLFLRYEFTNGDQNLNKQGVYLDDIWVEGYPPANLTVYAPPGWSAPLVASADMGTHTNTVLYDGYPTFVDWCIKNTGAGPSRRLQVSISDNMSNVLDRFEYPPLEPGDSLGLQDISYVLQGSFTGLKLRVDMLDSPFETNFGDNEYSFPIYLQVPTIEFSGRVKYWDLNPEADSVLPVRRSRVEMWDQESLADVMLDYAITDDDGYFWFPTRENFDVGLGDPDCLDVYFLVRAENDAARVLVQAGQNVIQFQWESDVRLEVTGGTYDTTLFIPKNHLTSGPFYIADIVLDGFDKWITETSTWPSQVPIWWNNGLGTYYRSNGYLLLDLSDNASQYTPDTYDRDVILHEYSHHLEYQFGFCDSTPGGNHYWNQVVIPHQAAHEGFASAASCILRQNRILRNRFADFGLERWYDLENGEWGTEQYTIGAANNTDGTEAQVACILWDIYDQPNDDVSACPSTSAPDGILDSAWLQADPVLNTLLSKHAADTGSARDITEFQEAWVASPHNGHLRALQDICYEHGISCCVGKRGDVNGVGGDGPTLGDVAWLIDYLFVRPGQFELPGCVEEANVAPDNPMITITDITELIDHLYISGEPLPDCPCVP